MKYKFFTVVLPIIALVVASFYITIQFIKPSPKKEITIATGSKNGNYYKTALEYKALLEKENVKVNLINSAGSVENIELLKQNKADMAFVQNGTITNEIAPNIKSLASIYYEPLWVFYKNDGFSVDYIIQFITKKISINKIGSGTRDLAIQILKDNGIDETNSTILDYDTDKSKEALLKGEIDVVFIVSSHKSEAIKELLEDPKINLLVLKELELIVENIPI